MSTPDPAPGRSATLAATLRTLAERWWVLAACLVIGAGLAYGLDKRKTKLYEGTAVLQIGAASANIPGVLNQNASSTSSDPQRDQGTTLSLVSSTSVSERVRLALKLPGAAGDLAKQVTASAQPDTNLIDITARDSDPKRAAQLANAFAEQYRSFRQQRDRQGYAEAVQELQQQRDQLPTGAAVQRANLTTQILQLSSYKAATTGGVDVVGQASPSAEPASPRPKKDAAIGGILGLALGAALVFGLDVLDRRLKGLAAFEAAYDIPATALVPQQRAAPRNDRERLVALEPFRILRSGLRMLGGPRGARVVLITSAIPGEGKSTVAAGLARAVALSGQRVALVELDLRRPTFHEQFTLGADRGGMTDVLLDRASLDDVLRSGVPGFPTLEVVPAGGVPQRSVEMLGSPEMQQTLEELASRFDVVVLDAPPLLPVADTRVLLDAAAIDVVLIVGRSHHTGRDQAAQARAILEQHRVRRLGLVVNGVRTSDSRYEYAYRTSGGAEDGDQADAVHRVGTSA